MNHIPRAAPLRRLMREASMPHKSKPEADPGVLPGVPSAERLPAVAADALPIDEQRRVWNSDDLLGGDTEALIMHHGQTYRLRRTKQGKLILYK